MPASVMCLDSFYLTISTNLNNKKCSKSDGWSPALNTLAIRSALNIRLYDCRKFWEGLTTVEIDIFSSWFLNKWEQILSFP